MLKVLWAARRVAMSMAVLVCAAGWSQARAATSYAFELLPGFAAGGAAMDVNNAGEVVGIGYDAAGITSWGFRYQHGVMSVLAGPAGAISADASAITDAGVIYGNYSTTWTDDGSGTLYPSDWHIYRLDGSGYQTVTIPGLTNALVNAVSPNGRWIAGTYAVDADRSASFVLDTVSGAVTPISSTAEFSVVAGINDASVLAGYDRTYVDGHLRGPAWISDLVTGDRTEFQILGASRSAARDVSATGTISGYFYVYDGRRIAAIHGYVKQGDEVQVVDVPGFADGWTTILGANDSGMLVGSAYAANGEFEVPFLAQSVPELPPVALLGAGLLVIAARRRQRR